jgi:hypothetical protein
MPRRRKANVVEATALGPGLKRLSTKHRVTTFCSLVLMMLFIAGCQMSRGLISATETPVPTNTSIPPTPTEVPTITPTPVPQLETDAGLLTIDHAAFIDYWPPDCNRITDTCTRAEWGYQILVLWLNPVDEVDVFADDSLFDALSEAPVSLMGDDGSVTGVSYIGRVGGLTLTFIPPVSAKEFTLVWPPADPISLVVEDRTEVLQAESTGATFLNRLDAHMIQDEFTGHIPAVRDLEWSPDGSTLVSSGGDSSIILWDAETGGQVAEIQATDNFGPRVFDRSPGSSLLASATIAGLTLWDTETGEPIEPIAIREDAVVHDIAWSPDGTMLAAAFGDGTAMIWDSTTRELLRTFDTSAMQLLSLAWSPDSSMIAGGTTDLFVWEMATGRLLHTTDVGWNIDQLAWSPDNSVLAAANIGYATLFDTTNFEIMRTLEDHEGDVEAVAWSPDGSILATGATDDTVILWDASSFEKIGILRGHTYGARALAWSPDGSRLAVGTVEGWIAIWSVNQ